MVELAYTYVSEAYGRKAVRVQVPPAAPKNNLMITVYALSSLKRNYIYVGQTNNVAKRFKQHNDGHEKTTQPYRPFKLIYTEEFNDRITPRVREKYLKSGVGKEFLKNLDRS